MARPQADVNYRYFLDYVTSAQSEAPERLKVLDFGCGQGQVVKMLRDAGVECYGAEVFYEGRRWDDPVLKALLKEGAVREIAADGSLPFEDGAFDMVVSNQVMEHVEDLEAVIRELSRVLRADGIMYHHFPSREVIREGHIGIALAHRMRPGRARTCYTLALRRLGLGYHKDEGARSPREWTERHLDWLDRYCFYRPYREIRAILGRGFELRHREIEYCRFRAEGRPLLARLMRFEPARPVLERAFRLLAFMAIEQRRAPGGRARAAGGRRDGSLDAGWRTSRA